MTIKDKFTNENESWVSRIYNDKNLADLNTLYGQLSRIATNRAIYLSIIKMTEESKTIPGELIINFITDGYSADLVMTVRRLIESNLGRAGNTKRPSDQVNSIMGLVEYINDKKLINRVKKVVARIGDAPNKIFGHNDLMYQDGERDLTLASHNTFDECIKELFIVLRKAALVLEVSLPNKLVATNQFDWATAFDMPWRSKDFDDYEIWDEL